MKKIVIIFMFFMFSMCLTGCEINLDEIIIKEGKIYNNVDFRYGYLMKDSNRIVEDKYGEYVVITGLTEEGKKKEIVVIPEEIDEKKVTQLGHSNIGHQYIFESTNLKHCYLPRTLDVVDNASSDYIKEDDAKYYFIDIDNVELLKHCFVKNEIYVSLELFNKCIDNGIIDENNESLFSCKIKLANVTFVVDDTSYFIIDINEGELISFIPDNPNKEDMEFCGWYKEKECINEFDFDKDIVKLENGIMKIYGKWNENN